jgi:nitronate monooxygenase
MPPLPLSVPILQAPIGSCATPQLASAVSEAGGIGALALTWCSPEAAARMVSETRCRTNRPFQVNFVLSFEPVCLRAALEAGAPIVTFSWGLSAPSIALAHEFGALVGVQVSTAAGAELALGAGADFLIAQGVEAGGHVQATRPLASVLEDVVSVAKGYPVVAAGGIATGRQIAAVLKKGASAAMLGTRFVASTESNAHHDYKSRLLSAQSSDSTLTLCFDLGWPYAAHRVLRNKTLDTWESAGCPPSGRRPGEHDEIAHLNGKSVKRYQDMPALVGMEGSLDELCLYAGTGVGEIKSIEPAATLIKRLVADIAEGM